MRSSSSSGSASGSREPDRGVEPVVAPVSLAVVEARDDAPPDPDRVPLVDGEVVGQPGDLGVHLRSAERLVVGLLAGGHLHQRRSAEEDLRALLDHDDVVAHARHVGAAGGRVAEHQRHGGPLVGRGPGEVAEQLPARDEDLLLRRQVGAAGLDEVHRGQPVLVGDLRRPERLLQRPRVAGAALHGRVVGHDHALDALDHPDAADHAGADGEVRAPARQRHQLQERRALVDEQLDALARQQLAALAVPLVVALAAAVDGLRVLGVQRGDLVQHRLPPVALRRRVQHLGHDASPNSFAARSSSTSFAPPPMPRMRTSR